MKKATAFQFFFIAAVPFVMVLGNSMLIPVFPQMEQAMNISQFQVGLIITFFSLPAGIIIPFAGFLSDQYGRKIIIVPALFLYGIGGLISGTAALLLSQPYTILLVGRVVQGIGAGGTYQLAMALTGDIFQTDERTKALGLLEAANGLGKVVSPITGAAIALIIWYAPFFLYGVLAFPIALGVWFFVTEPKREHEKESIGTYWHKLVGVFSKKASLLLASYFVGMVALFTLFGVLSWVSDILETDHNIFRFAKGLVLAIPVASMAITSYISGTVLSKRKTLWKPAIVGGITLSTVTLVLIPLFTNIYLLMTVLLFLGMGIGLLLPPINTFITGATGADKRGVVTSLYGTVRFFGVAMGPPAFGLAIQFGRLPMFIGATIITTLAAVVAFFFITPQKEDA